MVLTREQGRLSANRRAWRPVVGIHAMTLYTIAEVAKQLRVGRQTIYDAVARCELQAYRFGKGRGTLRITEASLAAYLAVHQTPALAPASRERRVRRTAPMALPRRKDLLGRRPA